MPLQESSRLREVQPPVIPIVGEMIRAHPGTISLGQGVVYYGPPTEAEHKIVEFLAEAENHKYKSVDGIPPLRERLAAKLRDEKGGGGGGARRRGGTGGGETRL